ncbi:MAG: guanylate kinase [Chloroflexota bacterium]|nr:guanylate kinase [Chloroflexota bacterium]
MPADKKDSSPLLIIISGPSGVGKDAVLERMRQYHKPWYFIVTATTRPKRLGEIDGVDYIFMSKGRFQELLDQDGFLEYANVYGRYYGVPQTQIQDAFKSGQDVIVKTDVQGARTLRSKVSDALLIFLAPPDMEELERRLRTRKSETESDLEQRIQTAFSEMASKSEFDHVVVNHTNSLEVTVRNIEQIIDHEKEVRQKDVV